MIPLELPAVLQAASRAPSLRESRPWRLVTDGDLIDVRSDRSRWLRTLDPGGRQLHLGAGAAVELARLSIRAQGYGCIVRNGPIAGDGGLLGRLAVGGPEAPTPEESRLAATIPMLGHTHLGHAGRPLDPRALTRLRQAVADRGCWTRTADTSRARALLQALARDAAGTDGVCSPVPSVGHDAVLVVGSDHDGPHDWVRAGRALGLALVVLADEGLASEPVGSVAEVTGTREALRTGLGLLGHPQLVLRLGAAGRATVPAARGHPQAAVPA